MNRLRDRKKNPPHQELIKKGYSLEHPTKKQPKGYITELRWGNNGRQYWKMEKMTAREKKIDVKYKNLKKAGKQVWFTYKPNGLIMDFIFKYHLDVKKDKLGNVTVTVSKATKGKKKGRK